LKNKAAMCSHVPDKGEQMVRCYGYYSNVAHGKRKKSDQDELIPSILARKSPPQHHEVEFALTHTANFFDTLSPKSEFLSLQAYLDLMPDVSSITL
jgi:hypothetical protein